GAEAPAKAGTAAEAARGLRQSILRTQDWVLSTRPSPGVPRRAAPRTDAEPRLCRRPAPPQRARIDSRTIHVPDHAARRFAACSLGPFSGCPRPGNLFAYLTRLKTSKVTSGRLGLSKLVGRGLPASPMQRVSVSFSTL